MVEIKLTEDCMRLISQFESLTGAGSRDCVVDDRNGRLIFVINPGDMGLAIGKKGASIKKASEVMGKKIEVVEYNNNMEQFLKNCFLPAQVTSILFEGEDDQQTATVEVRDEDRGIAIGKEGKNIFKAKKLALRQYNIADVQILQKPMEDPLADNGQKLPEPMEAQPADNVQNLPEPMEEQPAEEDEPAAE